VELDQAGIGAQGRDWRAEPGGTIQDGGVRAGAHCPAGGDDDGVSDPPSIGLDDRVRELSGGLVDVGVDVGRGGMMRPVGDVKVYLHRAPIDMRTGRNGLAALVREGMQQDPFAAQALYVFIGRRYDALKILGWDRNGYAIWQKRIESEEKFHWPRLLDEEVITLSSEQLNWLLDGYDVWSAPHRMIKFTHVS
jgi:transposase